MIHSVFISKFNIFITVVIPLTLTSVIYYVINDWIVFFLPLFYVLLALLLIIPSTIRIKICDHSIMFKKLLGNKYEYNFDQIRNVDIDVNKAVRGNVPTIVINFNSGLISYEKLEKKRFVCSLFSLKDIKIIRNILIEKGIDVKFID
jgi:hypothetical protein